MRQLLSCLVHKTSPKGKCLAGPLSIINHSKNVMSPNETSVVCCSFKSIRVNPQTSLTPPQALPAFSPLFRFGSAKVADQFSFPNSKDKKITFLLAPPQHFNSTKPSVLRGHKSNSTLLTSKEKVHLFANSLILRRKFFQKT